jgi:DNA-binding response OmpR family regulator
MKAPDSARKKILLVDDESSITNFCQRVLTAEGFAVDTAPNGREAQELIERDSYDLCLIDIRTPVMDGKELYQWLQERSPHLSPEVIFTTGDVIGADINRFIRSTGRPFLPKPFSPADLKAMVKKTLKQVT